MANTHSHDFAAARLSEYMDDELSLEERADVDAHLRGCDECRQLLAELEAVARRSQMLPEVPPDSDLWPGIAARLTASAQRAPRVVEMRDVRRFSFTLPQLVAAGLALMVLSGGMVWLARLGGARTDFPALVAEAPAAERAPIAVPATFADAHYDEAIADLQQTLDAGRAKLDPGTVRVLEQNLLAIDRAIEQCRLALGTDPANGYLADHLAAAKKRKLALLRRANALAGSL